MNNLYIILCLVNIIAIQIHAKPTTETVYNIVTRNFTKTCPTFRKNILVNNLSNCKDVTLKNLPTQMTLLNMYEYYCVGIMIADLELCNSIALHDDKFLPKNPDELNAQLTGVKKYQNVSSVCKQLKSMKLFSSPNMIPKELTDANNELKAKLSGPFCSLLCTDINGGNLSDFCTMIYYLNSHLDNVTKVDIQNETKTKPVGISPPAKQQNHQEQNPASIQHVNETKQLSAHVSEVQQIETEPTIPPVTSKEQQQISESHLPVSNLAPELETKKSESHLPVSKLTPQIETKKTEKPSLPPAEQETEQPQIQTVPKNQEEETPKVDNSKGEQTSAVSKGETQQQNQVTNEATNDNAHIKLEKSEFASAEERDYPSTSTAINYMKGGADNFDLTDNDNNDLNIDNEDGDDDDDLTNNKLGKDTNVDAPNMKDELFLSGRMEISPNNKQVTEDLEESNFFSYFMFISVMFIAGYVVYHNKQKIMALLLEGRRDRNSRRRPSTSSYRKLNSNLEEAVTSKCSGSASHVIY